MEDVGEKLSVDAFCGQPEEEKIVKLLSLVYKLTTAVGTSPYWFVVGAASRKKALENTHNGIKTIRGVPHKSLLIARV
jgi:hypothetical protein